MNPVSQRTLDIAAAVGLAVGGVFGMAGTLAAAAPLRQTFWLIDGVALVVAGALLAVRYLRRGNDCVAAGFLVFLIGQGVVVSSAAADLLASVPSFAAGMALWAAALLLISAPREFPTSVRLIGVAAAALFLATAFRVALGEPLTPISAPFPFFAYPFLVLTMAGWIWTLVRGLEAEPAVRVLDPSQPALQSLGRAPFDD